jgi:hypothetical protein
MNEVDDFSRVTLPRQAEAEQAIVLGDPAPPMAMWSRRGPGSPLGAWGPNQTGWDELSRIFRWLASGCPSHQHRLQIRCRGGEVSGDLAYSVGFERFNASVDGGPVVGRWVRSCRPGCDLFQPPGAELSGSTRVWLRSGHVTLS